LSSNMVNNQSNANQLYVYGTWLPLLRALKATRI
jgi:hypothetical protein